MPAITITRLQKQKIAVDLEDRDAHPDTTTPISTTASSPSFTVEPGADNRHFYIVGQGSGAGAGFATFAAAGKSANVSVTVNDTPDMSSLTVSVDGAPEPK